MERAYKPAPVWLTEIFDPSTGVAYVLDEQNKIAHRMTLLPVAAAPPRAPSQSATRPQTTTENLGTQTMDGVLVEGTRKTTTFSSGRGLTIESWDSPEVKLNVCMLSAAPGLQGRARRHAASRPDAPRALEPASGAKRRSDHD